ncbi:hypothetical protein NDU88_003354 [Pleurodeles waltl]|uniref:Uncharacterized protein n=1 Tax=Pleurodeles waltl TaxID=8319 RepID=A0AAV7LGU3_PLEWA|nr:hypothetical protein NDU88_003354 [Pleurodeles waltl]
MAVMLDFKLHLVSHRTPSRADPGTNVGRKTGFQTPYGALQRGGGRKGRMLRRWVRAVWLNSEWGRDAGAALEAVTDLEALAQSFALDAQHLPLATDASRMIRSAPSVVTLLYC